MPRSDNSSFVWLLVLGFVFHLIYMFSIFDIYFRSPLVHGMRPQDPWEQTAMNSSNSTGARRCVLFVADGLRADRLFQVGYNLVFSIYTNDIGYRGSI
jgi:phosphatidylinositol glycan class N